MFSRRASSASTATASKSPTKISTTPVMCGGVYRGEATLESGGVERGVMPNHCARFRDLNRNLNLFLNLWSVGLRLRRRLRVRGRTAWSFEPWAVERLAPNL